MNEKMGVIISLESYQSKESGLPKVKYATNDSESIKELFIDVLRIDENNIYYFRDEQFTYMVGKSELQYHLRQMSSDTELYIYYVGHGFFSEGKNYLTTYDTSTRNLIETSLSFEDLFLNSFRSSGAKSCVAFIDACAEGVGTNQRGIGLRGIDMSSSLVGDESNYRYALYFACSPNEKSVSDDEFQHGVWTWFLIQALQGDEAAYDQGKYISTASLGTYLHRSVCNYTKQGNRQTPYSVISSNGSWKLVDYGDGLSFEEQIYCAVDEFIFQCNLADQELNIGTYGDVHNFAQARDLCWSISEKLCYDWEEIVASLEYYFNVVSKGKKITLTYTEKKELIVGFDRLNRSFPTYINKSLEVVPIGKK